MEYKNLKMIALFEYWKKKIIKKIHFYIPLFSHFLHILFGNIAVEKKNINLILSSNQQIV